MIMKVLQWLVLGTTMMTAMARNERRVVGGVSVRPPFSYPWMVAIFRYGEYGCGGTLIRSDLVITAAHCVGGAAAPLDTFELQLHRHNLEKSITAERGRKFTPTRRWIPNNYDKELNYNDLAILEFDAPNTGRTIVQIDHMLHHRDGLAASVLGWGAIRNRGQNYPILQEARLPLVPQRACVDAYRNKIGYQIQPTQFCAGFVNGGKDACQGDSGGPLVIFRDRVPVLVGIVSSGLVCAAPGEPGLYTRVASYYKWINGVLQNQIAPTPDQEL